MGWFDGWPFKTREVTDKEKAAFQKRVLPYGEEERTAIEKLLKQALNGKLSSQEILFTYLNAKDKYTLEEEPQDGLLKAVASFKITKRLAARDKALMLTLLQLELEMESMDGFPTLQALQTACDARDFSEFW